MWGGKLRGQHGIVDGKMDAMTVTIDSSGRLVLPKPIRQEAGFRPGMSLEIRVRDGRVEIEPAASEVVIRRRGSLLVAFPRETVQTLRSEAVEETQRRIREER